MPVYTKLLPPSLFELQELREAGIVRLVCEALITGLVAGLVIGFSRVAYTWINHTLAAHYIASDMTLLKMVCSAGFITFCGCIAFWCIHKEPLTGGSGIPQVELALRGKLPMPWLKVVCYKFLGTLATMCGGLSLGRAAPSVQMGSAIGCGVGRMWHEDGMRPRFLVGGAVAGLTACFGAPWAGICFAFEELRTFPAVPQLIFMALTAFAAWVGTDIILGLGLIFPLPFTAPDWDLLWLAPVCGVLCGILCWGYNNGIAVVTNWADRRLTLKVRLTLAFGLAFVLLQMFPSVMDGLAPTLNELAKGESALSFLVLLWAVKMAFNILSGSSNSPGGLLMPLLTVGGFTGALLAALCGLLTFDIAGAMLIPLCMSGFFAGIVRAPLTASFVVAETTGSWHFLPALLAVSFITSFTASKLGSQPIFTYMRMRQLRLIRRAARKA